MPATEITAITRVADLGATPAKVNHATGEMLLNMQYAGILTKEQWLYIMLHETAHMVLNTTDEVEADAWAFKQYAQLGYSLKASVKAMTRILNDKNPEHLWRMYLQVERAKEWDYRVNGNTKVYD